LVQYINKDNAQEQFISETDIPTGMSPFASISDQHSVSVSNAHTKQIQKITIRIISQH